MTEITGRSQSRVVGAVRQGYDSVDYCSTESAFHELRSGVDASGACHASVYSSSSARHIGHIRSAFDLRSASIVSPAAAGMNDTNTCRRQLRGWALCRFRTQLKCPSCVEMLCRRVATPALCLRKSSMLTHEHPCATPCCATTATIQTAGSVEAETASGIQRTYSPP